jgi:TolB-like protein/Tfp pilus assembly protein PilF
MPEATISQKVIRFGDFAIDLQAGRLLKHGAKVRLREQPFQVLASLLEHAGQVVTREELRQRLWPDDVFVDFENSLNIAIGRLREALGDSAEQPHFIETMPRRGYRFIAEVYTLPAAAAEPKSSRARLIVLPFVNLSGDPAQEYFSDAMTDEIITAIAGIAPEQLAVIARTTAMHYKGSHKDVARISREIGVDYVVEGGVRREKDQVAINVQLIQTSDQAHVFAKKYDTGMRDIFSVYGCIAQAIAAHVPGAAQSSREEEIPAGAAKRKPTEDLVAYNQYLQGRYLLFKAGDDFFRAKQCFEEAVARDPQFALAYDALGEHYWWLAFVGYAPPRQAYSTGLWYALRALECDNTLAETHALLGQLRKIDYNWGEVRREMDLALKLNPASPRVRFRNAFSRLFPLGQLDEAAAELETALELDPMDLESRSTLGMAHCWRRDYTRAVEQLQRVLEVDPDFPAAYGILGLTRSAEHKFDEAIAAYRKAVEITKGAPFWMGWLGLALAQGGKLAEVTELLRRWREAATQGYVPATRFAWIHLGLGEIDEAFTWMERAIDERDPQMGPIKSYEFLDPIRSDPRFLALLRKMNLAT